MRSLLILLLLTLELTLVPSRLCADAGTNAPGISLSSNDLQIASVTASNSLITLQHHMTPSNFRLMGFSSLNEVQAATNGGPIMVFAVPFSHLTNYQAGSDFNPLLEPAGGRPIRPGLIIPILVGTNVRSSSILRLDPGPAGANAGWVEGDWGHPQIIRALIAATNAIPDGELHPNTVPFAVRMPFPRIWLIGYYNTLNKLIFRATGDIRLGPVSINRSEIIPPSAMQRWATEARLYNPNLPN